MLYYLILSSISNTKCFYVHVFSNYTYVCYDIGKNNIFKKLLLIPFKVENEGYIILIFITLILKSSNKVPARKNVLSKKLSLT